MLRPTALFFALALCACSDNTSPADGGATDAVTATDVVQATDVVRATDVVEATDRGASDVVTATDVTAADVVAAADAAADGGSATDAADARAVDAATDAGAPLDAGLRDAGVVDVAAADGGDAGTWSGSDEILGTLRGTCGTVRAMLHSPMPALLRNDLTFVAAERYARDTLSAPGGQRLFDTANAGGSSSESEVMAYEVLHYCEGASLLRTETEIHYAPPDDAGANSITDILLEIGGERVGVSVTRAYLPRPMVFTDAAARELISRKLVGINRSSMRVLPEDRWVKQVLHVLAVDAASADAVERAWASLDAATRADTIVVVTVTHGGGFIYCNPDPALGSECPPIGG